MPTLLTCMAIRAYIVGMTALGEFEVLVIMAVLHLGDDASPPAVRAEIERRAKRPVARGAVYVTLDRLEAKKLLGSRVAVGAARARRYYRVAPKGLRAVRRALEAVEQMRHGLESLLNES
jgi:PadR family transcriptional regulator